MFIVPSYLFVFRYNLPYTPRHRDVGKRRQTRLVAAPRRTLTSFSSREATLKLLKALVCQAERLDVTIHSSWQATGERGRVPPPSILLPLLLLRLFLEATLIGIDFLLMSCHAKGFQRGNTTLCRRRPGQAATKAVTKIPPMKADTSFRKF